MQTKLRAIRSNLRKLHTPSAILIGVLLIIYSLLNRVVNSRLDPHFAPKSKFGLVPAIETPPAKGGGIDIIFVHGLGSNPDTTWQARRKASPGEASRNGPDEPDTFVNWVSDFLPSDIPKDLQQNVRLFFFNYESYWMRDSDNTRLKLIAADLLDRIDVDIRSSEKEKSRGLVFVGHSYGGLVVKQALVSASIQPQLGHVVQQTKGVLFLGTPHRGSAFGFWGWLGAQVLKPLGSNSPLLAQLEYDSTALLDLHRDFDNVAGHDWRIVNFFELQESVLLEILGVKWRGFFASEPSATFGGPGVDNIGLSTNHVGLNKYSTRDGNYEKLCSKLVQILKGRIKTTERIYAVPLKPADTYIERHELQKKIEQGLQTRHENASTPHGVTVVGLGGAGKSQLALNFAETHKDHYNPILWIDASTEDTVRSSFQRCARALKLEVTPLVEPGATTSLIDAPNVQAVRDWLREKTAAGHDDPWLVIVDNADDLTWGIEHTLPVGECGSIILTSQNNNWSKFKLKGYEQVQVDVMAPREASALLLRHLDMDMDTAPEHIRTRCDAVVEKLGYLALAVNIAGYHIANEDNAEAGIVQYLANFDRNRDALLKSTVFQELIPTQKTVWTAWNMTLEKLEKHHEDAQPRLLLAWLAHFDGTVIHYAAFDLIASEFAKILDPPDSRFAKDMPAGLRQFFVVRQGKWDNYRCRQAFDLLARYGLLQDVRGVLPGVTMHKLVRWRALQDAKDKPWPLWFLTAIDAAGRKIPYIHLTFTPDQTFAAHLPNLRDTLVGIRKAAEVYNYGIGHGLFEILFYQERLEEAEELMRCVMDVFAYNPDLENRNKAVEFDVMHMQSSVDSAHRMQKEDESIMPQFTRMRVSSSSLDPDTDAYTAFKLGLFYLARGQLDDAEALLEQVLEAWYYNADKVHGKAIAVLQALATVLCDKDRLDEAETLLTQVIKTRETLLGKGNYRTLESMSHMAKVYGKQGRWQEAEALQLRVVEELMTQGGNKHVLLALHLRILAQQYRERGLLTEAAARYVQLIGVEEAQQGEDDFYMLKDMDELAEIYEEQGRFDKAETTRQKGVERRKNKFGERHRLVASSIHRLANNYKMQGRLPEAQALERELAMNSLRADLYTYIPTSRALYGVAGLLFALATSIWLLATLLRTAIEAVATISRHRQLQ